MSKYINLEKQLVRLHQLGLSNEEVIKQFLLTADVVDAVEVRHGSWIEADDDGVMHKCSVCGAWYRSDEPLDFDYCPNCGAKMMDEEE